MKHDRMSLIIDIKTRNFKYSSKPQQSSTCSSTCQDTPYIPKPIPIGRLSYADWKSQYTPELINIISYITHAIETHDAVTSNGLMLLIDFKTLCDQLSRFVFRTSHYYSKRYYFLK